MLDHPFFNVMAPIEPLPPGTGLKFLKVQTARPYFSFW